MQLGSIRMWQIPWDCVHAMNAWLVNAEPLSVLTAARGPRNNAGKSCSRVTYCPPMPWLAAMSTHSWPETSPSGTHLTLWPLARLSLTKLILQNVFTRCTGHHRQLNFCKLKWRWEVAVPELKTPFLIILAGHVKMKVSIDRAIQGCYRSHRHLTELVGGIRPGPVW
jgi:hypothetical protein